MIWTINRIIQNFRINKGAKFSRGTITYFAARLGYHIKHSGGLIGYDKSLYTVLTSHYPEMVKYQNEKDIRKAQKASKREIDYNPDKFIEPEDRADYDWEKNESMINRVVTEYRKPKTIHLSEDKVRMLNEYGKHKPIYYSMNDRLELGEDPYSSLEKEKQTGKKRNFQILRNGESYWVSRSSTISLYVFCRDENGEWNVLASQRGKNMKFPNKWNVVSGFLDYGESLEAAAIRECYEECGVNIQGAKLISCGVNSEKEGGYGSVNHRFATILDGTTNDYHPSMENCEGYGTDNQEVQNVGWIPITVMNKYGFPRTQVTSAKELANRLLNSESTDSNFYKLYELLHDMLMSRELDNNKYSEIINILKK